MAAPRRDPLLRKRAEALRRRGQSYREIQLAVGVSMATLSLWLRDIPLAEEHRDAFRERQRAAGRRGVRTIKTRRLHRERLMVLEAADQVSALTRSELFIAGVVAYWAEGSKSKPWRRELVRFINSDPQMILLFLAWLDLLGIGKDLVGFRLAIHSSADVEGALRYWSEVVRVPVESFKRTTLKRGNPRTARKNVGDDYHGCLRVEVRKSTDLNTRISGWFQGIMSNLPRETSDSVLQRVRRPY